MSFDTVRDIIRVAGGPEAVAGRAAQTALPGEKPISAKGVYSWFRIGIPEKHWDLIMDMTAATADQIYAANRRLDQACRSVHAPDCRRAS